MYELYSTYIYELCKLQLSSSYLMIVFVQFQLKHRERMLVLQQSRVISSANDTDDGMYFLNDQVCHRIFVL